MRNGLRCFLASILLLVCTSGLAQDYEYPIPFQRFNGNIYTVLDFAAGDTAYGMRFYLSQTVVSPTLTEAGPVAASFMYYLRMRALASVRYAFRVDTSGLSGATVANRSFQIFAASSPVIVSGWPQLLTVNLVGDSPFPALKFMTPRGGKPLEQVVVPLTAASAMVRVEINVGAGTAGNVRYWIDADYADPPTGILEDAGAGLDNAAWSGVIAAAIGMSSTTSAFRANCGGTFSINHITSSDDLLFGDNFEFGYQ